MDFTHNRPRLVLLDSQRLRLPPEGNHRVPVFACGTFVCQMLRVKVLIPVKRAWVDGTGGVLLLEESTKQSSQPEGVEIKSVFNYRQLFVPPRPLPHRDSRRKM